jgi:hypothetical protein
MNRALCLVGLVAACGKSGPDCKARVGEVMAFLDKMDHEPPVIGGIDDVKLVQRPELPAKPNPLAEIALVLRPGKITSGGQELRLEALADELTTRKQHAQDHADKMGPRFQKDFDPDRIAIAIDASTPWSQIVAVTDQVSQAKLDHVWLVFDAPSPVAPPPRVPIDDDLDKLEHSDAPNKATEIARLATTVVDKCPAMKKVFGAVSSDEDSDKAGAIISGTGPALIDCDCAADPGAIRALLWRVAGNRQPERVLEITLADGGDKLAFPPTATWKDVAPKLQGNARVHLALQ